jgi:hypothetical protein
MDTILPAIPQPKTKLPPRKRATTEVEKEQRRIERVGCNRRAAYSSKKGKQKDVESLKAELEIVKLTMAHMASELKVFQEIYYTSTYQAPTMQNFVSYPSPALTESLQYPNPPSTTVTHDELLSYTPFNDELLSYAPFNEVLNGTLDYKDLESLF